MASRTGDLDRLSGVTLPLVLQRKLQSQKQTTEDVKDDSNKKNDESDTLTPTEDDGRGNVVFTAEELEERVWKARSAMADIQKQLLRGEETYYEETNAHGNLFRGWDLFIDARDSAPSLNAGNRRMPADYRWFSSSCTSIGKNPPRPFPTKISLPPPVKASAIAGVPHQQGAIGTSVAAGSTGQVAASSRPSNVHPSMGSTNISSDAKNAEAVRSAQPNAAEAKPVAKVENDESKPETAISTTSTAVSQAKADTSTSRRTRKRKASES